MHWRNALDKELEVDEWVRYVPEPRKLGTSRFGLHNYGQIGRVIGFSQGDLPVVLLLSQAGRLERILVPGIDLVRAQPSIDEETAYLIATLEV